MLKKVFFIFPCLLVGCVSSISTNFTCPEVDEILYNANPPKLDAAGNSYKGLALDLYRKKNLELAKNKIDLCFSKRSNELIIEYTKKINSEKPEFNLISGCESQAKSFNERRVHNKTKADLLALEKVYFECLELQKKRVINQQRSLKNR